MRSAMETDGREAEKGAAGPKAVSSGDEASEEVAVAAEGIARVDERPKEMVAELEEALLSSSAALTVGDLAPAGGLGGVT